MTTPREELADVTADALARGISAIELSKIQNLGDDGYGIVAQLEQLYVWLAEHPRALSSAPAEKRGTDSSYRKLIVSQRGH